MAETRRSQLPFHSLIVYTSGEVNQMDGSWTHLTAALGCSDTQPISDMFYENATSRQVILEYCQDRRAPQSDAEKGNWGLPSLTTDRIVTSKKFLDLISKDYFLDTLKMNNPPVITDLDSTYRSDFPNIFTMWHATRLIKAVPSFFPHFHIPGASSADPYDMVHAFYLLKTFHSKRHTSLTKGVDRDSGGDAGGNFRDSNGTTYMRGMFDTPRERGAPKQRA